MKNLTIVATIKANAGAEEKVYQELLNLIDITRAEEGCIEYTLHRSIENPGVFLFYETWASKELWQKHMEAEHMVAYGKNTETLVASWDLYQLAKEDK